MNEEQETRLISENKETARERLLSLLILHPQVFPAGIGAEAFVKELIKAFTKYAQFTDDEIFAMEDISQIIRDYPQVIRPDAGAEEYLEDLHKASIKYFDCFPKPEPAEN
jgi:hypothetical protein